MSPTEIVSFNLGFFVGLGAELLDGSARVVDHNPVFTSLPLLLVPFYDLVP